MAIVSLALGPIRILCSQMSFCNLGLLVFIGNLGPLEAPTLAGDSWCWSVLGEWCHRSHLSSLEPTGAVVSQKHGFTGNYKGPGSIRVASDGVG